MFAACVFPVCTWAIFAFFEKLPSWLLFLSFRDLVGLFAYTEFFALLESTMVLLAMILLGVILPGRFFRDRFAAQGSTIVLLSAAWGVKLQREAHTIRSWPLKTFVLWSVLYLMSIGVAYLLIHRYERLEQYAIAFAERLTILLYIYVPLSLIGLLVVILLNC